MSDSEKWQRKRIQWQKDTYDVIFKFPFYILLNSFP
jgi:hypothetical protein